MINTRQAKTTNQIGVFIMVEIKFKDFDKPTTYIKAHIISKHLRQIAKLKQFKK